MTMTDQLASTVAASPPHSSGIPSNATESTIDERLSSILSSPQFSVASYLNLALQDEPNADATTDHDNDLSQRMAELALQLQLQTQACHEDIGRIGAELQAILPRCSADVGRVGVGLEGLRLDAAALLDATSVIEESEQAEVSSSLETLSTLHALQANLTRTKDILTAAATWDTTLSSVAPLLAQQNLTEAVNALAQLENGERALRGMPHPEERTEAIAKIRQQVTVMLQPQLKHALANMNTRIAPLQQCVSLYSKLGKMDTLKEEYVKNRPASIHKAWFDYTPSYQKTGDENKAGDDDNNKEAALSFLSWLPGWFDAVLSLVTEERRQSMSIFGAELVSEITIKVFRECFRPILASFKSRLESIYSSSPTGQSQGSLETICAAYESTLQFLSLTYEAIAGGWLDMVETGALSGSNGVELYNDLKSIFLQVASPFAPYQQGLSELEAKHSGQATRLVAKDIRQAASSTGSSLATLQDATERLQGLSNFVFPMLEGAVARFELMNGGYGARNALSTIDKLLADHTGELALAVHTLSAAMTTDEKQLAENFDDSHVHCALDVLKLAGTFRRSMRSLEDKTRERMAVLGERMAAHVAREKEVEEAASTRRSGSKSSSSGGFLLPDAMSAVEIDSIITKSVCGVSLGEETSASLNLLQRLAASGRVSVTLYPQVDEAIGRLANSCHSFVFDVCYAVPRRHLSGMSSMSAWKEKATTDSFASYGTLPQNYITHVGEHMLALVQALEPFASDTDALSLANEVMSNVRDVALPPWRDLMISSGTSESDQIVRKFMDGKEIVDLVVSSAVMDDEEEDLEEEDEAAKASATFCNLWLDVVGLAVTGRLLERIMRIPALTPKGCEHLNADLNYLVNVFSALGVSGHPHPLLGHLAELCMLDSAALAEHVASRDRSNPIDASLGAIEERLAAMRAHYN